MTHTVRRLEVGTVLHIAEADYLYGTGVIHLRLNAPLDLWRLTSTEWVRIVADEILWRGDINAAREVVVRVSAIAVAIRPIGWLPESAREWQARQTSIPSTEPPRES